MKVQSIEHGRTNRTRAAYRVAATLCVLGLASVIWLHGGSESARNGPLPAVAATANDFLHAPASVSSVPSAESVFGSSPQAASEEMPPTF